MKSLFFILGLLLLAAGCAEHSPQPLFPDPCVSSEGHTHITFTDLSAVCTIEIYTLSGDRVRKIVETDGDGQVVWDLKNDLGKDLTGGMYLYIITSTEEVKEGKLLIAR